MVRRPETEARGSADRNRDPSLEGIRGLAAIVVVLWHNLLGFFPRQSGSFAEFHHSGMRAMPWYGLVHGTAAVTVFFVLSGLVLSRAYLLTGDASIIARGALKRWPRLAGPVIIVVVISALLDRLGLYRYDEAAALTGSSWLAGHLFHAVAPEARTVVQAVLQGALTFFRGDSTYDTSLWTMRYEMTGSYVVFGLVLILGQLRGSARAIAYLLCVSGLICLFLDLNTLAFVAGVCIAHVQLAGFRRMPPTAGAFLAIVGVYLLGYSGLDAGWFRPLARLFGGGASPFYLHLTGAVLIITATDGTAPLRRLLQTRASAFLGWISFPLYLVHIPVLCSAGCAAFLSVLPLAGPRAASLGALLTTAAVSVGVAVPLAMINDAWTARVDRWARRFGGGDAARHKRDGDRSAVWPARRRDANVTDPPRSSRPRE